MGGPRLRLYTDRLSGSARTAALREANRAIYVAEGQTVIRAAGMAASLAPNSAWQGRPGVSIATGPAGARLLRWEFSTGEPELLRLAGGVEYLMHCDRVDFPPGEVAFEHTHQGPGIRCLQEGRIRIQTQGRDYAGGAWFETGIDSVYAQTRADGPSHFIRVIILPRAIQGKSSIRYVKPEDQDRPKTQQYQVFWTSPSSSDAARAGNMLR